MSKQESKKFPTKANHNQGTLSPTKSKCNSIMKSSDTVPSLSPYQKNNSDKIEAKSLSHSASKQEFNNDI